jgi:SH3 domain-containing YSC84-like protein 1
MDICSEQYGQAKKYSIPLQDKRCGSSGKALSGVACVPPERPPACLFQNGRASRARRNPGCNTKDEESTIMKTNVKHYIWALAIAGSMSTAAFGADRAIKVDDRLDSSADALIDMMKAADNGIPQDLIDKARCVIVIPGMKKAGFIFGAEYGRGFAVCRRHGGVGWSAPAAMRSEGGSFGFQIGASDTDVVMLVMNDHGMKHLLSDKFTLGGDATVAAGPIGRAATAQTEVELQAEILSYSRSHGLFAGISLTGATLRPDNDTNRELYHHRTTNREILTGNFKTPVAAGKFEGALNRESARRN